MRLIDAENLILDYSGLAYVPYNDFYGIANLFAEQIRSAPSVDPVHAAGACYCRECKYFDPDENIAPNTGSCSFVEMVRFFDDFCSKGERKEETP